MHIFVNSTIYMEREAILGAVVFAKPLYGYAAQRSFHGAGGGENVPKNDCAPFEDEGGQVYIIMCLTKL